MNILLIEDETDLQEVVKDSLAKEGFLVETADTFQEGLKKISFYDYDCVLLDITLPGGDGLQILEHLKNIGKSENVIIISAKDSVDDKIRGLNLGADDYLTKPFHIAELNARVKSVLRRKTFEGKNILECANIKVDLNEFMAHVNDIPMTLNRKEFDILVYLMANRNRLISKSSLAEKVWGDYMDDADDFEFLYSQIKNLRKKLKDSGAEVKISAMYGMGYKLEA
ncbi:DNA-binding response regulator, OmpR family, contains REC and winged-helix (wHTH) domain [Chitinophaga sp. YR627]|uniref:response regulator transcription factor n=1 Tax=Chitinophaga sp. YR627 TaxID=1881041 RepID=UPI0008EDC2E9|nr:response regulator transcription factor [Chitinophaga sp. YR627]SFM69272.1 DNA-binding response regulator, OmpR family, contains REC and winged-helix (wHTH) domain [Chitinophaga sp. YR627]